MKPIPPEFEPVITRFTERLAKLRPEMVPHLDDDNAAIDAMFAFTPPGGQAADRADSDLSDEAAINQLFARKD